MERNEILKSVGFSDKFLNALNEFEKSVPNVYYEVPFDETEQTFNVVDTSGQLLINRPNDNYNSNIIVQQAK
jgi:hypothetical protein